jgi:uncharacterized membrane protein YkvA (DUF1232 family)
MASRSRGPQIEHTVGFLGAIIRELRLIWRLMVNRQVPLWAKLVPLVTVGYILSPIDLVPDWFPGLGQLDDVAILLIGLRLFVELCPRDVVQQLRSEPHDRAPAGPDADVVDTTYRVLDE